MDLKKNNKLNQILETTPEGIALPGAYLAEKGYSPQLVYRYTKFNRLKSLARGVYYKLGMKPEWQGVVLGLQRYLNNHCHLGGISALNFQGIGHYLPIGGESVHLYGEKFPRWLQKMDLPEKFECHKLSLFSTQKHAAMVESPTKIRDWKMLVSTPERAILEVIDQVKNSEDSFVQAAELLEGLTVLRAELLQTLLESCKKIIVKRVFLYLAERSGHNWFTNLDLPRIYLGKGKRQVIKGGALDKTYEITVPQRLAGNSQSEEFF